MNQSDLFDSVRSGSLKSEGMERAADNVKTVLEQARVIAREYASRYGRVNADDVGKYMKSRHGITTMGPAAGSIFRGKEWIFTGNFVKSSRITNHSRLLREWRLRV